MSGLQRFCRDRARRLYELGCSDGEIGRRLGVWPNAIAEWRRREGLEAVGRCGHHGSARPRFKGQDAALRLHRRGASDRAIGTILGVSHATIGTWRRGRGLPVNGRQA